jgi:hypothetical protein
MDGEATIDKVTERWRAIEDDYRQGRDRPLSAYAGLMTGYGASVVVLALVAGRRKKLPFRLEGYDLALFGVATHKLSRMLAKDAVASPIRAPFTRFEGRSGPAELKEDVKGSGWRKAVGELVSCPFCMAQWIGTGFVFGGVFLPRFTRTVAATFAIHAISDWLQFGYVRLEQATGERGDDPSERSG